MGLVSAHFHMLDHRLIQRCAGSLFFSHLIHSGNLSEQPLYGPVEALIRRVFIDGEPLHGLGIALSVIQEQIAGHGADDCVQMLIHEMIRAALKCLNHRPHQVIGKILNLLQRPVQILFCIPFCHLIGGITDNLCRYAHAVHGNPGMDMGVGKVRVFVGVQSAPISENRHGIFPVCVIPCHIVQNCLRVSRQPIRDKFAVESLRVKSLTRRVCQLDGGRFGGRRR